MGDLVDRRRIRPDSTASNPVHDPAPTASPGTSSLEKMGELASTLIDQFSRSLPNCS